MNVQVSSLFDPLRTCTSVMRNNVYQAVW